MLIEVSFGLVEALACIARFDTRSHGAFAHAANLPSSTVDPPIEFFTARFGCQIEIAIGDAGGALLRLGGGNRRC